MPKQSLQIRACVLAWKTAKETHRPLLVFSQEQGLLTVWLRQSGASRGKAPILLDLFDDAELSLGSSNQGRTWFLDEARVLRRRSEIGRSYEALSKASKFAALIGRNPIPDEGRERIALLLEQALNAFADKERHPELVYLKALYNFARGEGYPVKQDWLDTLQDTLREQAIALLKRPSGPPPLDEEESKLAVRLVRRLEDYLRGNSDILMDEASH